ncbi:MAG: glycoside hydrolase family 43 protein [Acetatifactor sp.]|nr:glycoside hydrolase family 43 protein [Acetatifactor sp.]
MKDTYTNPIMESGADPWVILSGDAYYYCCSSVNNSISLARSEKLEELGKAELVKVYEAPKGTQHSAEIWAPELHFACGSWYIYYAADDGDNMHHRMYVLRGGSNPLDPLDGEYSFVGKVADPADKWAIDGTILEHDGKLYFIWSGWEGDENIKQDIFIAPMSNPWTISGDRVRISTPDHEWERNGNPWVNEGPEILKHGNAVHIIYSASGSWTDEYCLGRLTCTDGNFLNPGSWVKAGPVFAKANDVFGPGHASFVKSKDGERDYIVYHAAKYSGAGWNRDVRLQQFGWEGDNPLFGEPVKAGEELPCP